ncbi:MAG: hypothetical protein HOO00_08865 [Rhodospirillaceae bacterium]|nr:hypothetical protein [Rhodospirillaceae bacterium]
MTMDRYHDPDKDVCLDARSFALGDFLSPLGSDEFFSAYLGKKPFLVERANKNFFSDALTLPDIDALFASNPNRLRMARMDGETTPDNRPPPMLGGKSLIDDLEKFSQGYTLIFDKANDGLPKLKSLCNRLAGEIGFPFRTNVYLTPSKFQGFSPHFDDHDVFVLQCEGSKHWQVEKQRRLLPRSGDSLPRDERELIGEIDDFVLEQGSLLYIPRGYVHAAEASEGCSLHITLGLGVITWADVLASAVAQMIETDDGLKESLPPNFLTTDTKPFHAFLSGFFTKAAKKYPMEQFADRFLDEILGRFQVDMTGGISSVIRMNEAPRDNTYVLAEGVVCRLKKSDDEMTVILPGKEISLPIMTEQAVTRLFSGARLSCKDLPSLDEDEAEVLIKRFVREGIIRVCEPG